jgi:hypothetical protein
MAKVSNTAIKVAKTKKNGKSKKSFNKHDHTDKKRYGRTHN